MSDLLARIARSEASSDDIGNLEELVGTVADGARCNLAVQQQAVVGGLLAGWRAEVTAHVDGSAPPAAPELVAELIDITDGEVVVDLRHRDKQPDWTYDEDDSGASPADRLGDHRLRDAAGEER